MDPNTKHFLVHTMHRLWTSGNYMLWVSLGFSQLPGCLATQSPEISNYLPSKLYLLQ